MWKFTLLMANFIDIFCFLAKEWGLVDPVCFWHAMFDFGNFDRSRACPAYWFLSWPIWWSWVYPMCNTRDFCSPIVQTVPAFWIAHNSDFCHILLEPGLPLFSTCFHHILIPKSRRLNFIQSFMHNSWSLSIKYTIRVDIFASGTSLLSLKE